MALRVLCAFQTEEIFEFVKSSLKTIDCEVIKANNEALAHFLAHKNFPCLVLSELQPDGGWGLNLFCNLKAEPDLEAIPFVFLSRHSSEIGPLELNLVQGASMLLWYPMESQEFVPTISAFLHELKDERSQKSSE